MIDRQVVLLWARLLSLLNRHRAQSVVRAYHLALLAHEGQVRDGGNVPYIVHPLRVALILAEECRLQEPLLLSVALLHDTLEDSPTSPSEIERACGPTVLRAVQRLTKVPAGPADRGERDATYFSAIATDSREVRLVKCADRLDNLRSMQSLDEPSRLARYLEESRRYLLPIAAVTHPFLHQALQALCEDTPLAAS